MLITALYRSWIVGLYRSPAERSAEASHSIRVEPTQRTQRTQRRYLWCFCLVSPSCPWCPSCSCQVGAMGREAPPPLVQNASELRRGTPKRRRREGGSRAKRNHLVE